MTVYRTHLFEDNTGKRFKNNAPGVMANTACHANYHNYRTSLNPDEVDCRACRNKIDGMRAHDAVPRAKVAQIADNIHQLMALKADRENTIAKALRGCVAALKRTPGSFDDAARRRKINEDKAAALLCLEYLATQLENHDVSPADKSD